MTKHHAKVYNCEPFINESFRGFSIDYESDLGFGTVQLVFSQLTNARWVDNEYMSKEFCMEVLEATYDYFSETED